MHRRDRIDFLDRLLLYRRVYHLRSDYDARPLLSVREAIAHAERVIGARIGPAAAPAT